jgi:colanic acid biosynthesis glycosyl transferase WcaI
MPSKLLGMLASGKAVIATAEPDTEIGKVIKNTGILVPPGACEQLCEAIKILASSPETCRQYGQKGRAYACEHWSAEKVLSDFQKQLDDLMPSQLP